MTASEEGSSDWQKRQRRFCEFLTLRREQLGLTIAELEALIKRKRCNGFDRIESGEKYLDLNEHPYVAKALRLPDRFLRQIMWEEAPFGAHTASDILDALNHFPPEAPADAPEAYINCCSVCREQAGWLLTHYGLAVQQVQVEDKTCLCQGKRRSDSDLLLRLALTLSAARVVLILGGSPDVDRAIGSIGYPRVFVVRSKQKTGLPPQRIFETDVIVIARGEVGHADTAPYINALKALPKSQQPLVLRPLSSNITGIAQEILWNRDVIRKHVVDNP